MTSPVKSSSKTWRLILGIAALAMACAGAWGFTCAMFYMSFFTHIAQLNRPDHGPIEHTTLTTIIGVLFALTVFAFVCSLVGYRGGLRSSSS